MAYVSKVTAERRDIRELEQVIAASSNDDLALLSPDEGHSHPHLYKMPLGIEPSGSFACYVRCCAVVIKDTEPQQQQQQQQEKDENKNNNNNNAQQQHEHVANDGIKGRELWMGDREGSVLISLAVDGSPAYQPDGVTRRMINQYPNTFPTAIGQVTFRDVWVCYQDASIKAFDLETLKPRWTTKRHGGSINDLTVIESANIVATCSEDFLIYIWEGPPRSRQSKPSTELPKLIGKFAGHTNYVRAMVASPSGHHLFTAAADGTVRCYDLVRHVPLTATDVVASNAAALGHGTERSHRRDEMGNAITSPTHNTRNSRDIFYLFLHDVGSMLGVVSKTAVTIYVVQTSAVHIIFEANNSVPDDMSNNNGNNNSGDDVTFVAALYSESTGMLWVSRSDGLIVVYDLHTFELSGIVDAHMNTVVQLIQFATCAATVRVVGASANTIAAKDSNSDVKLEENAQTNDDMKKLVHVFQQQRVRRQAAERDLAVQKRQLLGLKNYDANFKSLIASVLERYDNLLSQSCAIQRSKFFVLKRKHENKSRLCAVAMENKVRAQLASRYFHDWFRFWCGARTNEAKRSVQGAITRMTERSLQSRYLQRGMDQLRRGMQLQTAARRVETLLHINQMRKRQEVFDMWRRWMLFREQQRRTADFSASCLRYNAELARTSSFTAVHNGAYNARTFTVRKRLMTAMDSVNNRALLRRAYQALLNKRKTAAKQNNKIEMAKKLELVNGNISRSASFGVFMNLIRQKRKEKLEIASEQLNTKLEELNSILDDENVDKMTPDEVSNLITETEIELQDAQKELKKQQDRLTALEDYIAHAEREKKALSDLQQQQQKSSSANNTTNNNSLVQNMEALSTRLPIKLSAYSSTLVSDLKIESATATTKKKTSSSPTKKKASTSTSTKSPSTSPARRASSASGTSPASRSVSRAVSPSASVNPGPQLTKNQEELKLVTSALVDALGVVVGSYPSTNAVEEEEKQQQQSSTATTTTNHQDASRALIVDDQQPAPAPSQTVTSSSSVAPVADQQQQQEQQQPVETTATTTADAPAPAPSASPDTTTDTTATTATTAEQQQQQQQQQEPKPEETNQQQQQQHVTIVEDQQQQQQQQVPSSSSAITSSTTNTDSWSYQSAKLVSDYEAEHAKPSDEFRAMWDKFHAFNKNAERSLCLYQVYRASMEREEQQRRERDGQQQQQQQVIDEATQEKWNEIERSINLNALIERVEFARQHPELCKAPPAPAPAAAPAKTTSTRKKSSSPTTTKRSSSTSSATTKKKTATTTATTTSKPTTTATKRTASTAGSSTAPKKTTSTTATKTTTSKSPTAPKRAGSAKPVATRK